MKLHANQLGLLEHLAMFETLDYLSCLRFMDIGKTNDRKALSYAFRPLTKNDYAVKHKDGSVNILAKGRALFPDIKPLVTLGGGAAGAKRVNTISRTAMFLRTAGIESFAELGASKYAHFIPSTCWRKIRPGILSTARFSGILSLGAHRLAVYAIGDGEMDWQMRAERSLFYQSHGTYETRATGMLLICDDDKREKVAEKIIRTTMWQRKQLIGDESVYERDKPVKFARAPIRVASYYEHVYLTTPEMLKTSFEAIYNEKNYIVGLQENNPKCQSPKDGDFEAWPYRYFINIATDLLKFVYYFTAAKSLIEFRKDHNSELNYGIMVPKRDYQILATYPDVVHMEGTKFYEYRANQNDEEPAKQANG